MGDKRTIKEKIMSSAVETEIVSRLLNEPILFKDIYGFIQPSDFVADEGSLNLYSQMCEDFEKGIEWSTLSLMEKLKSKQHVFSIADYLSPETVSLQQFNELVDLLKEMSLKRQLIENASMISTDETYLLETTPDEIVTQQLSFLTQLRLSRARQDGFASVLDEHKKLMEERFTGTAPRIPTGFDQLDNYLAGGFQRQDFIVIGARPSIGKTALALTFAYNAAKKNIKTLFISVEMRAQDIIDRLLAFELDVECTKIIRGEITKELLEKGYEGLRKLPLSLFEVSNATSGDVYSISSKEKYKNGLDLVVVDYMQVLSDVPGAGNERTNLNSISRTFKMTARLLDVALISPSQVTRKAEQGENGMPNMSQLRESGNIESDADLIILMSRDQKSDESNLWLAKNRKGSTGVSVVHFNKLTTQFYE